MACKCVSFEFKLNVHWNSFKQTTFTKAVHNKKKHEQKNKQTCKPY